MLELMIPESMRWGFPGGTSGKELSCQCKRHKTEGSIPRSGRSPGVGKGNPLQYSCLKNLMDRGAWQAMVYRVTELDIIEVTQHAYTKNPEI